MRKHTVKPALIFFFAFILCGFLTGTTLAATSAQPCNKNGSSGPALLHDGLPCPDMKSKNPEVAWEDEEDPEETDTGQEENKKNAIREDMTLKHFERLAPEEPNPGTLTHIKPFG